MHVANMEIIISPSARWVERAASSCREHFDVASPFVGQNLLKIVRSLKPGVSRTLLTRTRIQDFAAGASDLKAVTAVAEHGCTVNGLHRLHAKVYIADDTALVTSANATYSGWNTNAECGVAIDQPDVVWDLREQIRGGFGANPPPTLWTTAQLKALEPAVDRVRRALPRSQRIRLVEDPSAEPIELPRADAQALLSASGGWTQLVFQCILRLNQERFTTTDLVEASRAEIASRFPANRHPREKVRQQLQVLRDLGLIHFTTPGNYRLMIRVTG